MEGRKEKIFIPLRRIFGKDNARRNRARNRPFGKPRFYPHGNKIGTLQRRGAGIPYGLVYENNN